MFSSIKDDLRSQWARPNATLQRLIMINIAVFILINLGLLFISTQEDYRFFMSFFAMPTDPATLLTRPWTFITSFFTHEGFWHLLWNMLYLYWFGMLIREYLGSDRLLSLYILGGLSGSIAILALNFIPALAQDTIALGASAAGFAVMVGAATLVPDHTFHLFFFGPVKIKYIASVLVVLALFSLRSQNYGGEFAHLSGAFVGYAYIRLLQKGTDLGAWITQFIAWIKSFFVPQAKMKVNYTTSQKTTSRRKARTSSSSASSTSSKSHEPSQEEIDTILDKISQNGYESLSKAEKEKLFNASKKR